MIKPKFQESTQVIILYTYRYIWKDASGRLCVKFLTEPQEGHRTFQESIKDSPDVVSCVREYVNEVNLSYLGFTEPVKEENKNNQSED